ncbi:hypothetical protein VTJ04DRAFT_5235 [Mycothermus thermophilus]|uniref:uncharacterized protein n=1 Tax=Humicola insolens TaxID=85995 RepID=UPI00374337C0
MPSQPTKNCEGSDPCDMDSLGGGVRYKKSGGRLARAALRLLFRRLTGCTANRNVTYLHCVRGRSFKTDRSCKGQGIATPERRGGETDSKGRSRLFASADRFGVTRDSFSTSFWISVTSWTSTWWMMRGRRVDESTARVVVVYGFD